MRGMGHTCAKTGGFVACLVILVHGAASEALGESADLPAPLHTSYPQVPHDCSVKLTGGEGDYLLCCLQ